LSDTSIAAVILATRDTGITAPSELGDQSAPLVEIAGKTLVQRVVEAARESTHVRQVVVVGGQESPASPFGADLDLPASDSPAANLLAGLLIAESCTHAVLMPGSLPFLTPAELDLFLSAALDTGADIVYPMVPRASCQAAFPDLRRHYFGLAEGEVTAGCALFANRVRLAARPEIIEQAVQLRREPWRLALLVGPLMVLSFSAGRLGLRDIGQAAQKALGLSAAAILVDAPGLAMDVRKPIDLKAARERLAGG